MTYNSLDIFMDDCVSEVIREPEYKYKDQNADFKQLRKIFVEAMLKNGDMFRYDSIPVTLDQVYLAINLFDIYYNTVNIETDLVKLREDMVITVFSCIMLASKLTLMFADIYEPIRYFMQNQHGWFKVNVNQLFEMVIMRECQILKVLGFMVYDKTLYTLYPDNPEKVKKYLMENPSPDNL